VTITVTCYSWAPSDGDHLFTCGAIYRPPYKPPLHDRKGPPHKRKAPLLTTFWRRFWLTLHNSQVHCSGVMQWWACGSLVFTPLRGQTWERIFFWCCCLLRNNITAANLQLFASSYDRRRFTAYCFWTLVPRI